jgi:hypothetical protein
MGYKRAVVIDTGPKNTTSKDALRSERQSALKKELTEPALLEMSGEGVNQELTCPPVRKCYWLHLTSLGTIKEYPIPNMAFFIRGSTVTGDSAAEHLSDNRDDDRPRADGVLSRKRNR